MGKGEAQISRYSKKHEKKWAVMIKRFHNAFDGKEKSGPPSSSYKKNSNHRAVQKFQGE